jgi:hypothetical protein
VQRGRVVSIGRIREGAREVIDADGLVVAPGWETNSPGKERTMSTILIVILILLLLGVLPLWPHSANWGYYPSGGVGLLVLILIILLLTGRL